MTMSSSGISYSPWTMSTSRLQIWSRSAGQIFLDWLKPAQGLRWIDVGCGNGAFDDGRLTQIDPRALFFRQHFQCHFRT